MMGLDLLLIVGVIAFALGWRSHFDPTRPARNDQTPLELLNARYARGEISREQYETMKADMG